MYAPLNKVLPQFVYSCKIGDVFFFLKGSDKLCFSRLMRRMHFKLSFFRFAHHTARLLTEEVSIHNRPQSPAFSVSPREGLEIRLNQTFTHIQANGAIHNMNSVGKLTCFNITCQLCEYVHSGKNIDLVLSF